MTLQFFDRTSKSCPFSEVDDDDELEEGEAAAAPEAAAAAPSSEEAQSVAEMRGGAKDAGGKTLNGGVH